MQLLRIYTSITHAQGTMHPLEITLMEIHMGYPPVFPNMGGAPSTTTPMV